MKILKVLSYTVLAYFFDIKKQRPKTDLEKCYQPSPLHLMHLTAHAHASTCATGLKCVKSNKHHF